MKRIFLPLLFCCTLLAASCTDYKAQIEELEGKIDALNQNLDALNAVTANLGGLRNVFVIYQAGDPVVSVTKADGGYDFVFKNSGKVSVGDQTAGVSLGFADGEFYWTLDGKNASDGGKNVPMKVTPVFRAQESGIQVSFDGGKNWQDTGLSTEPVVTSVTETSSSIAVTLFGGTTVEMPKESVLTVMLSGDGSTLASEGKASVDFLIDGEAGSYSVTPLVAEGWTAEVKWENARKGTVEFTAPAGSSSSARLYFCDPYGRAVVSDIDFSTLKVDEDFPVMYPAWDAYAVACEGGTVEVDLYTNLDEYEVKIEESCDWLQLPSSKAVRHEKVALLAAENSSANIRSALVEIISGDYIQQVAIWQEAPTAASNANLSADGTANCYIVTAAGNYYFDATVAGNGDAGILPSVTSPESDFPASSELSPVSAAIEINQNNVIENVRFAGGKVYFHATGAEGNATISVKGSRNYVIWSWHIWCTDMPKERTHTNPDMLQFTVLDRNLGATSADPSELASTYGMYYQWGRKDPFDGINTTFGTNSSHAFAFATRYPKNAFTEDGNTSANWYNALNDYLWGNPDYGKNHYLKDLKKSIYDPCPLGYMVPPANTFKIFEEKDRIEEVEGGILVRGDYGQTNFYPYQGFYYRDQQSFGTNIYFWHSPAARYGSADNGGGAATVLNATDGSVEWYYGMPRSRALPIRCVKQVAQ